MIYPQEEPFPYIVSANIGQFETYDLATEPCEIKISLKYNDYLYNSGPFRAKHTSGILPNWFFGDSFYQKNYNLKTGIEEVTIDGKEYSLPYTEFIFDIGLPTNQWLEKEPLNVNFVYEIQGLTGVNTKKAPANFMLNLSVPPVPEKTVSVEEINITSPTTTMAPGQTLPLTATVLPENATDKSLTWSSSNPGYAAVDDNGIVTAKAAGAGKTVVITAEANDGSGVKSSITIQIQPIASKANSCQQY